MSNSGYEDYGYAFPIPSGVSVDQNMRMAKEFSAENDLSNSREEALLSSLTGAQQGA
ncbi:MAG: hypothetical protein WDA20_03360 [Desulfuromonadales bacterium]